MKITIFGLTISSSWGNGHATPYRAILRALHGMGHDLVFYEKDVPYYASRRDFYDCEYCSFVLYQGWEQVRDRALRDADESDVVITASYVPEGARIADEILEQARPLHVFYDLDTPITLKNLMPGVEYLRPDQVPEFDLYLSFTGGQILRELEQDWGARLARPLYGCVDPDVHFRLSQRDEFSCLLSYMGTYASDRQQKLESLFLQPALRRSDNTFVLAGSLYPRNWQWPKNVRLFEHIAPAEHSALYSSSRFTLNLTRDGMARSGYCPSGRFFEAAACGTPIISDWFKGLDHFFVPDEELFVAQCTDDVMHALETPDAELASLASRARERTLAEHTGECRARQLLSYFEEASTARTRHPQTARMTPREASHEEVA